MCWGWGGGLTTDKRAPLKPIQFCGVFLAYVVVVWFVGEGVNC